MKADGRPKGEREISRRVLCRGAKFDFEEVTFAGNDGRQVTRQVVRHPGAVVIVPVLERAGRRELVMIRNFRTAIGAALLELPAGTREAGEEAIVTAERELSEETGYECATIVEAGRFYTSPGLSDELMYVFIATGLREAGQKLEMDEQITVERVEWGEAMGRIERGELLDAKSIAALMLAERKKLL